MNKYSEMSKEEISQLFTNKMDIDTWRKCGDGTFKFSNGGYDVFTEKFCFSLIEKHELQIKKEDGLWWCRKFSAPHEVSVGHCMFYGASSPDLKRAILECVLMIEDKNNESRS